MPVSSGRTHPRYVCCISSSECAHAPGLADIEFGKFLLAGIARTAIASGAGFVSVPRYSSRIFALDAEDRLYCVAGAKWRPAPGLVRLICDAALEKTAYPRL